MNNKEFNNGDRFESDTRGILAEICRQSEKLSNKVLGILVALVILGIWVVCITFGGMGSPEQGPSAGVVRYEDGGVGGMGNINSVSVSATAEGLAVPDIFSIDLGIDTIDSDPVKASSENAIKAEAFLKYLKSDLKLPEEGMKTVENRLSPRYIWNKEKETQDLSGYEMRTTIRVTCKDIKIVSDLVAKSPALGVTRMGNIESKVSNYDEVYNEVLKTALRKARAKADALAEGGNFEIVGVLSVDENGYNPSPVMYRAANFAAESGIDTGAAAPDSVAAGETSITAQIHVVFQLEQN